MIFENLKISKTRFNSCKINKHDQNHVNHEFIIDFTSLNKL